MHLSAVAGVSNPATALQQAHATLPDSTVVTSPLPGGVAEVVRFLLNAIPPWLQMLGVVLGAAALAVALRFAFQRRRAAIEWLDARSRSAKWVLAASAVVMVAAAGGAGAATWNYTQHDNDFCTGCHVMNQAFQRFADDDNKHGKLSCHSCHQQPVYASMRQLYLWVAERPQEIGKHAKVPNEVCRTCHVTGDTATWQHVAATAGHRVHLESDSAVLKDLQCVTCHGVEVHRFRPVEKTCGQSDCHDAKHTTLVLGKMAAQTVRHCTSCHGFTAGVPALATRDSARGTLVPGRTQCLGCHEMQKVLRDFNEGKDPHGGKCGACHNPHTQKTPAAAKASCATAGCHANWRDNPFHSGDNHSSVGKQCGTCHAPHSARVDASDCQGCHTRVREGGVSQPPVSFDTAKALRPARPVTAPRPPEGSTPPAWDPEEPSPEEPSPEEPSPEEPSPAHGPMLSTGGTLFEWDQGTPQRDRARVAVTRPPPHTRPDSFPHARHAKLACLECHETGAGHGRLTFEPPRGCAICHHQSPAPEKCASCHRPEKYGATKQVTLTVTVPGKPPHARPVAFLHAQHTAKSCVECHTTPVTLALAPARAQCKDCHSDHHTAGRDCQACHKIADPRGAHMPVEAAHQRCDACHTATTIARLVPTRSFCGTCHATQAKNHYDQQECTSCHFLAEPAAHRPTLVTPPRPR